VPVSNQPEVRAPREDGGILAVPPLDRAGALLDANHTLLAGAAASVLGRPLPDLARAARAALLAEARAYLAEFGEPAPSSGAERIVMAGHQPELFHPGVWVKNFALAGVARRHGATAVNLIVDYDTIKTTAIRVPALGTDGDPWPHRAMVAFDHWNGEVPYEEGAVRDEALFASFPERVEEALRGCGFVPLLEEYWPEARRRAERTPLLGERLAGARRELERRWGCHNFEVPVSRLCRTEPFAWFAGGLLADLPRFHALYNEVVHDYRRRHDLRSRNHPVPDLAAEGDWLEAPFWAWRTGQRRRGRLLARTAGGRLELRAGAEAWPALPLAGLVRAWRELEGRGFKVRPRALTNTLYARLFLTDLFVHGIGGGKYDELTDGLMRGFYGVEPPAYLVLSGTLLLPLPAYPATPDECRALARLRRDLTYNPQRHLADGARSDPAVRDLVEQRAAWVARQPADAAGRRERFRRLRGLNELLWPWVTEQGRRAEEGLALCERRLRANALLRRRDYAFCLYPEETLRPFCTQFL
jgi:hypothetical protein